MPAQFSEQNYSFTTTAYPLPCAEIQRKRPHFIERLETDPRVCTNCGGRLSKNQVNKKTV